MTLFTDVHEPKEIDTLIRSTGIVVSRTALNGPPVHYADYYWKNSQGNSFQVERKHWTELFKDLDQVEEQLDRQRLVCDSTTLLVEDIGIPTGRGVASYSVEWQAQPTKGPPRAYFRKTWNVATQPQLWDRLNSWFWRLDKSGVGVVFAPNLGATAILIARMYQNTNKPFEPAFTRIYRPQVPRNIRGKNAGYIRTLMGLSGARIGEKTARQLIDAFDTPHGVFTASQLDLQSFLGPTNASNLLKALGRV